MKGEEPPQPPPQQKHNHSNNHKQQNHFGSRHMGSRFFGLPSPRSRFVLMAVVLLSASKWSLSAALTLTAESLMERDGVASGLPSSCKHVSSTAEQSVVVGLLKPRMLLDKRPRYSPPLQVNNSPLEDEQKTLLGKPQCGTNRG